MHGTRWARFWQFTGLLGLFSACDDRPLVIVSVSSLPADAAELYVSLNYRGSPAIKPAPIVFPINDENRSDPATFGVRLEAKTDGALIVGTGVLSAQGCLQAFGSGAIEQISKTATIDIPLTAVSEEVRSSVDLCHQALDTPVLLSVTPSRASAAGGDILTLLGWGFGSDKCAEVSINAIAATSVHCRSVVELSAQAPMSSVIGAVPLQVLNPLSLRTARSSSLFSYYAENITFDPGTPLLVDAAPSALAAGLIDDNTDVDLAVTSRDQGTVTVLLNSGGDFPLDHRTTLPVGVRPSGVGLADVTGDSRTDVLVTNAIDHTLSVLAQTAPAPPKAQFAAGTPVFLNLLPSALATGDIDGNGSTDVVVANQLSSDVSVLLNQGNGSLRKAAAFDFPVPREPLAVQIADFDSDGKPDLVVRSEATRSVTVRLSRGGSFPAAARSDYSLVATPTALVVTDLDGNKAPDAVVALADGTVHVLWNDGSGALFDLSNSGIAVAAGITALGAGDLDLDGNDDIVATSAPDQRLYVLRNTRVRSGQRGLERVQKSYAIGKSPVAVVVADLNGDARPDVAVADQSASKIDVLFNSSH